MVRRLIRADSYRGKGIAVFTSGGDSQGMNAALRAVVRFGVYLGCNVYFIKEGYQGMVDGGNNIQEASWSSVSGIIQQGGTIIGSARCKDFRERAGRLKAAKNLIEKGITNLVVIGGDGSLTGANRFRQEWASLIDELHATDQITKIDKEMNSHINIVGMVGSIDNDFCGTDMTIGTDTALHRIIEAADAIVTTAQSHQRTFILEVMGRHCGYLALVAGIVCEADYIFIPEWPPEKNWPDQLCRKLSDTRENAGKRLNIIMVSEGAIDRDGNAISCEMVKKVIVDTLHHDTRITVLGHVQRGGAPSAFDRILGCRLGAESVMALMEATPTTEPFVISMSGNSAVRAPLMECVEKTLAVSKAMENKQWDKAVELRGKSFQRHVEMYKWLSKHHSSLEAKGVIPKTGPFYNLAIICVGSPCCGINAAVRSFVRNSIMGGHTPFRINNGFDGFIAGDIHRIGWGNVTGWAGLGGAQMGTKRSLPHINYKVVAEQIAKYNFHGLLIIGNFEAYQSAIELSEQRDKHPEFCIPIVVLPATISNNVPGSDLSIGTDTALNEITEMCDRILQSAQGTKHRVFIVEVMGGYCGYLTTMAGLAGGSDTSYIHEETFSITDMMDDLQILSQKMNRRRTMPKRGLVLCNEKANVNYSADFIKRLYAEEGKDVFSTRLNVLGHMQQGGKPSPFDRSMGTKMAAKAFNWLVKQLEKPDVFDHFKSKAYTCCKTSVCLLGLRSRNYLFQPVEDLKSETDFRYRRGKDMWWKQIRSIVKILAKHDCKYIAETEDIEESTNLE